MIVFIRHRDISLSSEGGNSWQRSQHLVVLRLQIRAFLAHLRLLVVLPTLLGFLILVTLVILGLSDMSWLLGRFLILTVVLLLLFLISTATLAVSTFLIFLFLPLLHSLLLFLCLLPLFLLLSCFSFFLLLALSLLACVMLTILLILLARGNLFTFSFFVVSFSHSMFNLYNICGFIFFILIIIRGQFIFILILLFILISVPLGSWTFLV